MVDSKGGICRVCLAKTKKKCMSIYEKYKDSCASDYINAIANVQIQKNDGLPDRICPSCLVELEQAVQFKLKCESSHIILTSTLPAGTEAVVDVKDVVVKKEEPEFQFYDPEYLDESFTDCEDNKDLKLEENTVERSEVKKSRAIDLHLQCDDCKEFFKSKCKLRVHWKRVHLTESLKCTDCKRKFKSFKAFNVHKRNKTQSCKYASKFRIEGEGRERKFYCKECSYTSRRIKDLITHIVVHTGERPFVCDICFKTCTQRSSLIAHQESAHPERGGVVIPCHVCGKLIKGRSRMYRHMRVHKESKFSCDICKKMLKSKSTLISHMNRHKGIKLFTCEICAKTFVSSCEMSNHRRTVHEKRFNIFTCDICGYSAKKKEAITKHRAKHSTTKLPCNVCGMFFETKQKLLVHQQRHFGNKQYECLYCDKKFHRRDSVHKHIRKKHKCVLPAQDNLPVKKENAVTVTRISNENKVIVELVPEDS